MSECYRPASDQRTAGSTAAAFLSQAPPASEPHTPEREMTIKRMDNVGIVVEDLEAAIGFFRALGLEFEGQATIEGEWAGRITGLGDQHVEIAMMRTPDGHSRLELSRFIKPQVEADHRKAPVNALGYLRVMFAVDDLDATLEKIRPLGAQLVGEIVRYQDAYLLCYIRGPEGLLIGLAQELGAKPPAQSSIERDRSQDQAKRSPASNAL